MTMINRVDGTNFTGRGFHLRKGAKVVAFATMLATSPFAAKAQKVFLKTGERAIQVRTAMHEGNKAALYFIDNDRNMQTAEKAAIYYQTASRNSSEVHIPKGSDLKLTTDCTLSIDTIVQRGYEVTGTNIKGSRFYAICTEHKKSVLQDSNGKPLAQIGDYAESERKEVEISPDVFSSIKWHTSVPIVTENKVYQEVK